MVHSHLDDGKTGLEQHRYFCCFKCISWSAVIAGGLVGVGLTFLVNLFSIAIGLSVFTTGKEGTTTLVLSGFIAMLVGVIAALFVAGWVAGYLGRKHRRNRQIGTLYGFLAWSVALLITASMAASMNQFVTTYYAFLSDPHSTVFHTTTNEAAPAVTERTHLSSRNEPQSTVTVNVEKAANALGVSLLITFFMFLLSAIASSFGGYYGAKYEEDEAFDRK
jgi:hypothetical protein